MLKIPHAGCLGLSTTVSAQFTLSLKCVLQAEIAKNSIKTLMLGVQGRSSPRCRPETSYYHNQRYARAEILCSTKSNSAFEDSSPLSIFETQRILVGATILTTISNVVLHVHETIELGSIQIEPGE